jgi:hypothetical protein
MRVFLCALSCAVLAVSPCLAATVEPDHGSLSINHGQGFEPVNSQMTAKVGDSVMVAPGGTAMVVYDDGCKVAVQPGSVITIAPLSPCASGSYAQDQSQQYAAYLAAGGMLGLAAWVAYEATQSPHGSSVAPVSP